MFVKLKKEKKKKKGKFPQVREDEVTIRECALSVEAVKVILLETSFFLYPQWNSLWTLIQPTPASSCPWI